MKRTKRYGGFRIGDRVRVKGKRYKWLKEGVVKALTDGYCSVYFKENSELLSEPVHYCFMPDQLINITRIEEEQKESSSVFSMNKERRGVIDYNPDNLKPFEVIANEINEILSDFKLALMNGDCDTANKIAKEHFGILGAGYPQFHLKDIVGEDYEFEQDEDEPTPDPLPSPYTRDVYTTTKDYD